jgi:hypothetical protein
MRFVGTTINGTPILLITLLTMVAAWSAAAEIYAAAIQIPGHGELAALVLVGLTVLCAWLLVFNLAGLAHDVQELRLPQRRQLLGVGLVFIFGFILVVPCALVWSLSGSTRDVFMIGMGSVAGAVGAVLWRVRPPPRSAPAARITASAVMPSVPRQLPKPWRAVRVALGPPFAPASWRRRGLELAILCAAVAGAPLLVLPDKGSLQARVFPLVLHAMEFVGFLAAIGLCWAWPLSRLLAIFNPARGALSELALLPGLGGGRQQFRRLYLVALSVPAAGLILLLSGALMLVKVQHLPHGSYLKLVLEFLLIPLITLPILLGQIAKPSMRAGWSVAVLMLSQIWSPSILIWSDLWDAPDSVMVHRIRALILAIVLAALIGIIGFSIHSLRKLLKRPHPFVEVSS